ncbi:MAG: trypsin-like peptidase domain-containing protein [Candidatus Bathyarchaeota archaeon]|jgi:S1-C subfamily serine protease|nr:PDZ domain-containing protein [Candidatus Bathyarchaeota archaeon A05DMB-3]MDH7607630.1 trypsin-like peptidase domain-containing protein [Candidatus Bathyarchaeota archaeon]
MELPQKPTPLSKILITTIVIASLLIGGLLGYSLGYLTTSEKLNDLESQLSTLQEQMSNLQSTQNVINQNNTFILGENVSLSGLYEQVKDSVVIIRGVIVQYDIFHRAYYTQVQGSGFVYNFTGGMVIITNYHVVESTINVTVTFINGNGYAATVLGSDPYADLAVLLTDAPQSEFKPLEIVSSSTLKVGDIVVAVGNPYGLAGSMSIGVVSALGRTITEETGGYPIANIIQTTAPLNPGNSGGPLLNLQGQVVGITTAIVSDSQGLGFAIPSNTILREISSLAITGSYNRHPWLGATGVDMTYEIAKAMGVNVTYGWLITQVTSGGPAANAGLRGGTKQVLIAGEYVTVGGDIIIAINETRITDMDTLSTYLEENTTPGQKINVSIVRENQTMTVAVTLGTRP